MNSFGNVLQTQWDWRAAGNFIFAGSGGALMLMIAIASYNAELTVFSNLTALALVGLGLLCVWLEIGRPWRFLHVFFHPQTSWMTREASVAVLLFVSVFAGVLLKNPVVITIAGVLGLLFLYCQGMILRASKGIPVWREPAVVSLFVLTGLAEGAALLFLLMIFTNSEQAWLLLALPCLIILRLVSWQRYRTGLVKNKAPAAARKILDNDNRLHILLGNFAPLLLLLLSILFPAFIKPLALVACLLALLSGWMLKFTIITRASKVQGYALGKLHKGRPQIKPPVRRDKDRFVFDRKYGEQG